MQDVKHFQVHAKNQLNPSDFFVEEYKIRKTTFICDIFCLLLFLKHVTVFPQYYPRSNNASTFMCTVTFQGMR